MPKKIDLFTTPSPGEPISTDEIQHMVDRYKEERYKHITEHVTDDSRAVWISKAKIFEFFNNNPDANGVRMYFGIIGDTNKGYEQGVHNLVLVPTKKSGTSNNDLLGNDNWVVVLQNIMTTAMDGDREGAICPPPKDPCGGNIINY
ncbi:hypothetical protein WG954_12145 [Lacibacter sp. H375]|uniref:hypothetical protein n=1 Tax=Lacibacter sp. H375 TaxID=3133424 RepID=UPI0030BF1FB2